MIHWTIDHHVTGSGQDSTVQGTGDLCVWFHDSDHTVDAPDRRVSPPVDGFGYQSSDGGFEPPSEVMTAAVKPEVLDTASQNKPMKTRGMQIFLDAFVGDVKKVAAEDTSLY